MAEKKIARYLTGIYFTRFGHNRKTISINGHDYLIDNSEGCFSITFGDLAIKTQVESWLKFVSWYQNLLSSSFEVESWLPISVNNGSFEYHLLAHLLLDPEFSDECPRLVVLTESDPFARSDVSFIVRNLIEDCIVVSYRDGSIFSHSFAKLTSDEWRCLYRITTGHGISWIAEHECWSVSKTKHIRSCIVEKLGVENIYQAISVVNLLMLR